ncbi:MAG: nicotinamide-nucleotide amidase [Gammaproteobacteria bacterium]|nr:nicotinamide-nucleotide amidase [Gammaproteobacteria bacterium]
MAVIANKVEKLAELLLGHHWYLTAAESCTGGWLAKSCTDLAGSSGWFERGFVTYTNEAKNEMLGVEKLTIDTHGAVSEETVAEMAAGALAHSHAHIAVAISGIAGPDGGSESKPVGTVCFSWVVKDGESIVQTVYFNGDREAVRHQAVEYALDGLIKLLS